MIQVLMQNKGRWTLCLNMSCPKKEEKKAKKDAAVKPVPGNLGTDGAA
jgi:hypothetical protein